MKPALASLLVAEIIIVSIWSGLHRPFVYTECELAKEISGEISSVRIETSRIQYIVQAKDNCTILVNASRWPVHKIGTVVQVSGGSLRYVQDFSDEFGSYRDYLQRQGISATVSYPGIKILAGTSGGSNVFSRVRAMTYVQLQKFLPEPTVSLAQAMLLAERGGLADAQQEAFQKTGTAHVLAISGLHIGILAGWIVWLLMLFPLRPAGRALLAVAMLWGYVTLIDAPVSAVRSATFFSLTIIGFHLGWLISLPTLILLTVFALVNLSPEIIFDVGFQLSISAVSGIFLALFFAKSFFQKKPKFRILWSGLLVSLGAFLGTLPLIAHHFGIITPISIFANILIVPLVAVLVPLFLIALLVSFAWMPAAILLGYCAIFLSEVLFIVAQLFARVPWAYFEHISWPWAWVGVYYLIAIFFIHFAFTKRKHTWHELFVP